MSVFKVEHSKDKSKFIVYSVGGGTMEFSQEDTEFLTRFAKSQPLNRVVGQTMIFDGYNANPDNKYIKVAINNTILAKDDDVKDYTSFCLTEGEIIAIYDALMQKKQAARL